MSKSTIFEWLPVLVALALAAVVLVTGVKVPW
jgi:hypothetical protein